MTDKWADYLSCSLNNSCPFSFFPLHFLTTPDNPQTVLYLLQVKFDLSFVPLLSLMSGNASSDCLAINWYSKMATPVLFIHSAGLQGPGHGSSVLSGYLRGQLEPAYRLICPAMPRPENPDYRSWKGQIEKQLDLIDDEVILIGHSLGGSVLLKYLSEVPTQKPIAGIFTIGSPLFDRNGWDVEDFAPKPNFGAHLISIPHIYLFHSRDDSVVPFAHLLQYMRALPQAHVRVLDGYGHLFERPCASLIKDVNSINTRNSVSIKPPKKMITHNIAETLKKTTDDFINLLREFDENQINKVAFEGSWTPGQVADHLIKSEKNLPDVLTSETVPTERKADEKIAALESIFLDFGTKLKSPVSIIPSDEPLDKAELIQTLGEIRNKLIQIAAIEDLSTTCTKRSFPGIGKLTRWEWLNFVVFHSTRHARQIRNIQTYLANISESSTE
jgi:uncharacterized protein